MADDTCGLCGSICITTTDAWFGSIDLCECGGWRYRVQSGAGDTVGIWHNGKNLPAPLKTP